VCNFGLGTSCLANYSEERAEKFKMIKEVVDKMAVKEQHETVQEYFPNADDGDAGGGVPGLQIRCAPGARATCTALGMWPSVAFASVAISAAVRGGPVREQAEPR
jgi:hypothetical protein